MEKAKTRVLLVEDNYFIVKGISWGLPPDVELTVATTRYDAEKALITDHGFDLVFLDGSLWTGWNSAGLARLALNTQERVRDVVAISADPDSVKSLISEWATVFCEKTAVPEFVSEFVKKKGRE